MKYIKKNENKCFFSISLENGITITGDNPDSVKDFLLDLKLICEDVIFLNNNLFNWNKYVKELEKIFDDAWLTIINNQQK